MKFRVNIKKEDGTEEVRMVEAPNRFTVYQDAEKAGETVTTIEHIHSSLPRLNLSIGTGISVQELITFTKNLAAMLTAGLPLSRALSVMERQSSNKQLKAVVSDLEKKVKGGGAFHEALAAHPKIFSTLFIAMSKSGEESGSLSDALKTIARQIERTHNLMKKVRGAMLYPAIILFAIVVIGVLMLVYIVPTLANTFIDLGVELPLSTRIILGISDFLVHNSVLVVGLVILGIVALAFLIRARAGRAFFMRLALHLPVIGELMRETYSARAARTMASLLSAGVEMLTALSITREVVGNPIFANVVKEAEDRVRKGEALSVAFAANPKLYPILLSEMIAVGEETGKVSDMLAQVGEYYEADVEDRTKDLSTVIEPVLMLIIGVAVGVFAVSMIGPIYSLTSKI